MQQPGVTSPSNETEPKKERLESFEFKLYNQVDKIRNTLDEIVYRDFVEEDFQLSNIYYGPRNNKEHRNK